MLHWTPPRLTRDLKRPEGFIKPCQPTLAQKAPSGPEWIHEIKHDGNRLIARKDGGQVRLWSRWGNSWTRRAVEVTDAVRRLPVTTVVLDGELLCPHEDGHSDFYALQSLTRCRDAQMVVFDLLMLRPPLSAAHRAAGSHGGTPARRGCAGAPVLGGDRGRRAGGVPARLRHGPGGDCLEAEGLSLSLGQVGQVAEGEEPRV
jgi:hypothetical protein